MPQPSKARLHDVEVISNDEVAHGIWRMTFSAPRLAASLQPGQFFEFAAPGDQSQLLRIPVSYSDATPEQVRVEFVYAVVGDGTRRMSGMVPGDVTTVVGPCGHGWLERPWKAGSASRALLVAGGVGVTPILGLARELGRRGASFDCVLGAQTSDKLWGVTELARAGASRVRVTTDDGSAGVRGFATDAMRNLIEDTTYGIVFACGPAPMMAGVAHLAHDADIECRVSLERMMSCGFGACATCNVALVSGGYASTCMNGPVFDAEEVAW